jgi:pyruvate/2-oxoglutarate dehydrogenase complex dihydrolipoamide acyltransferase (E2) component
MPKSSGVRTIRLPFRKIWSAIPAVALIGGGIILPASAAPARDIGMSPASSNAAAIVVPNVALTLPGSPQDLADSSPVRAARALIPETAASNRPLVSMLPAGTVPGSSSLVTLDSAGIPVRALDGYRKAASLVSSADPSCHIDWALLAAIGRVESDHARFGGNQLDSAGVARPGVIGIRLDGSNGTALITDTDHGVLDGDTSYDRAVGPMQFLPSTWRVVGVDVDGSGVKNPQDIADAATAAAIYLCSGHGDLSRPGDLSAAILRYNDSDAYVQMVTAIADAYRQGVRALPASDLTPAPSASRTSRPSAKPAKPASAARAAARATAAKAALSPATTARPQPGSTQPVTTTPAQSTPAATSATSSSSTSAPTGTPAPTSATAPPSTPAPTDTVSPCVPIPAPTSTAAPTPSTSTASATSVPTCLPTPCLATPAPTSTASATPPVPC